MVGGGRIISGVSAIELLPKITRAGYGKRLPHTAKMPGFSFAGLPSWVRRVGRPLLSLRVAPEGKRLPIARSLSLRRPTLKSADRHCYRNVTVAHRRQDGSAGPDRNIRETHRDPASRARNKQETPPKPHCGTH